MQILRNVPFAMTLALSLFASSALASTITGTVTNKTTNKPSQGDTVALIDVQAGMSEAASATTNPAGKYSIQSPGMGPYLIRVNHQGGTYFIAAPQDGGSADVNVFDVAAKVDGVAVDADMFLIEGAGSMLRVHERFLVRNNSLPPKAQFSDKAFEVVLPDNAELDSASATRPGGLPTNTRLVPLSQKNHYTFNIPIQPNQGEKETLFEVQYHLSYNGKFTLFPQVVMPTDHMVVYLPKGINFSAARGSSFQQEQQDPKFLTYVAMNLHPGQTVGFTVSGEGRMPESQAASQSVGMGGSAGTSDGAGGPGGGLGPPIASPDPLTKYKWWILSLLTLVLVAGSGLFLRKRGGLVALGPAIDDANLDHATFIEPKAQRPFANPAPPRPAAPTGSVSNTVLLNVLKEEMFAIEGEKLAGTLSPEEYARIRIGLEALLQRALKRAASSN
jgi:hypothetical protein